METVKRLDKTKQNAWTDIGFDRIYVRACLKNHSCNLYDLLCVRFCPHLVDTARCAALIQTKSSTNCDVHLTESFFQIRSSEKRLFSEGKK